MTGYEIKRLNEYKWEICMDRAAGMRVPGIIYADEEILSHAKQEKTIDQVVNVANLPGIVKASYAMPDIHFGYGFPIGGVAATDVENGVISPGGVGFDISCGVRLLRTNLEYRDIKNKTEDLMHRLFAAIPKGIGSRSRIKLSKPDIEKIFTGGVNWAIDKGYGWDDDRYFTEEEGCMDGANPDFVSLEAVNRGNEQVGSLGSGNHFVELQKVSEIYDESIAEVMGIIKDQVTVMIHSGSRGLGHQVCSDYLKIMQRSEYLNQFKLPDRQLACAPVGSKEGKSYYGAMVCAVNYAMVNRHCLAHWIRCAFESFFCSSANNLGMSLVYDVSHNIAKIETFSMSGAEKKVCVHRKGATRAFGPGSLHIPAQYRKTGQPVIIPGDMGRYSFILSGTEKAMRESFGSTCHGAGRLMSRAKAKREINASMLRSDLFAKKGIIVLAQNMSAISEEAPDAYKDAEKVVEIAHKAGISKKVAKLEPLGVIKG